MYWFGSPLKENDRPWESGSAWKDLVPLRLKIAKTPLNQIIETLDNFGRLWIPGSAYFQEALSVLEATSGFSSEEVHKTLSLLPALLTRESLEKRLNAEFQPLEVLDRFAKPSRFSGRIRAIPLGTLLHVTAGNVFLSSIDSLIMGLLTKNLNILKISSQNTFFPLFFAQKFKDFDQEMILADKFSVLHWKGGDQAVEKIFKEKVDGIVAWGGEEMMASLSQGLPPHVKFLGFGPKISLQVISQEGLRDKDLRVVARRVCEDIIRWDQSACASPQNLYLQEGIDETSLLNALSEAFKSAPPRGKIDSDEAVEILKEQYRALYSELMEGGHAEVGRDYLLHLEHSKYLKPSPLHRSLIIKRYQDEEDLFNNISPFSYYLQSCSYLLGDGEKDSYLAYLSLTGLKRFAPLGSITIGLEGAPHDGRHVLRELTHTIVDEVRSMDYGNSSLTLTGPSVIKREFDKGKHPQGYLFSSGGTTGEPKFIHFSYEEFDHITDMLAHNLRSQGIRPGMKVANLFVAGNLWSSFMAVEKALEKVGAIQLPIGGLCSVENILLYLSKFSPDAVMGIPSLLIMNAEYAAEKGIELSIPRVFYAGEGLSLARREFLKKTWKTSYFGSAGYASVDAGIIGYQCSQCGAGEHHLFSDLVEMKIVEGEAVVTSLYRKTLPIVNYRTGDRVEWIHDGQCGKSDKKFKLLGRIDNIIQIWSCRLPLEDIEASLAEVAPEVNTWQITLLEERVGERCQEKLELKVEEKLKSECELVKRIYENSRDLKDTLTYQQFKQLIEIKWGDVPRNERTGKVILVRDLRT